MKMTTWSKLAALLVAGSLLAVGCSKAATPNTPPVAAEQNQKPPLNVPAQFESEQAKREFAVKAVVDGYYREAAPLLEQLVKNGSTDGQNWALLGTARYNMDDLQGAINSWTKASELDPRLSAEMQNNIGNALRDSRKTVEAEAAYRKSLEIDPSNWQAAVNLAVLLKLDGRLSEAVTVLENANKLNGEIVPLSDLLLSYRYELNQS